MSIRAKALVHIIVCGFVLAGCTVSLQSAQYSFLKGLLAKQENPPEKNWRVVWDDKEYRGYAVNFDGGIYFANEEGLLVSFDGWQVIELRLPGLGVNKIADIRYQVQPDGARLLNYADDRGRSFAIDRCQSWKRTTDVGSPGLTPEVEWQQACWSADGSYQNAIELNDRGQLVKLIFTVLPRRNPVVIEYLQ
jgi:hypothetical protein